MKQLRLIQNKHLKSEKLKGDIYHLAICPDRAVEDNYFERKPKRSRYGGAVMRIGEGGRVMEMAHKTPGKNGSEQKPETVGT